MPRKKKLTTQVIPESSLLNALTTHPGWKVFREMLKDRKKEMYNKLRKCNRDSSFYKLQGALDEIDGIFREMENRIYEFEEETNG